MKEAKIKLTGITPISFSRFHNIQKDPKESNDDHEKRTWRERLHYDEKGMCYIPLMAVKNCLSDCAKYLSIQIKGKGKSTYTKHFEAGILVNNHIELNIHKDDVDENWQHVPSDGRRGGTKRVPKCFPEIKKWGGETTVTILDDTITKEVFEQHLVEAGRFIGIGRFRPRNNGYYGRFTAEVEWL